MHLSGYMNATIEPAFLDLKYDMVYLMHHPHETIAYSRNKMYKMYEIPHQYILKAGDAEIDKNQEYSNFLHTYCDADHSRDISDRPSVTSTFYIFNGNLIYWCANKQFETSGSSSNADTRSMYTGVLDQNWTRNFFR